MKKCKSCGKTKPFSEYYHTKDTIFPECKKCNIKRSVKWNSNNRDKKRDYDRKSWKKNREKRLLGLKRSWARRDFNNLRDDVLKRDGYKCVICGMTRENHIKKWHSDINVDHINRNRKENVLGNLQTLCLICHGSKSGKDALGIKRK